MIRIRELCLYPGQSEALLRKKAAAVLKIKESQIEALEIVRRSVDARKKPDIKILYSVDVTVSCPENELFRRNYKNVSPAPTEKYSPPAPMQYHGNRPVVVGFGPAGIFAALILAQCGLRPIVLERGDTIAVRKKAVEDFWNGGALDPESNVQFGEGGAGTFSDGKLNTGVNDLRIRWVLEQFVKAGAHKEILYDAKPHIGTDVLSRVVQNLRERIVELGGEVRFRSRVEDLILSREALTGLVVNGEVLPCSQVILAIGHSARDTFTMLHGHGIPMEPKAFSMGVRIEHPQYLINQSQYGQGAPKYLPPADYKLSVHLPDGTSAYTFCMCPGGYVVAAASEQGGVVTNGMSNCDRGGQNANSALLVTLRPEDFPDKSTLGGMYWQREIEQKAFAAGGKNYTAPGQTVEAFLHGTPALPVAEATYRPGVTFCDLHTVLPAAITDVLEQALPALGKKLKGFDFPGAVMTAPETRSSSPVRILRDANRRSALHGLYPCGEGAGYAGGITSAAVDGIKCAEALIAQISPNENDL